MKEEEKANIEGLPDGQFYIEVDDNSERAVDMLKSSGLSITGYTENDDTYDHILVNNTDAPSGSLEPKSFWFCTRDEDDGCQLFKLLDSHPVLLGLTGTHDISAWNMQKPSIGDNLLHVHKDALEKEFSKDKEEEPNTQNAMIKLTALNYKIKVSALEIYHKINELAESQMYEWEKESGQNRAVNGEYVDKPFVEPHEFKNSDYDIKERPFRVAPEDIMFYKENLDGITEITLKRREITFAVKESVQYLDKYFPEPKTFIH